jgi:hypothetical protein
MTLSTVSIFSAPFPQAHLIYIYPFHSEAKSYTIAFVFSYTLFFTLFYWGGKTKGFEKNGGMHFS